MDSSISQVGNFVQNVMSDQFMLVAVLTFFLCEGIFNIFPVERARMKQLTSLLIGGVLGYFLIRGAPVDSFISGVLSGGATTVFVAKFKKPGALSPNTVADALASADPKPMTPPSAPALDPAEHL